MHFYSIYLKNYYTFTKYFISLLSSRSKYEFIGCGGWLGSIVPSFRPPPPSDGATEKAIMIPSLDISINTNSSLCVRSSDISCCRCLGPGRAHRQATAPPPPAASSVHMCNLVCWCCSPVRTIKYSVSGSILAAISAAAAEAAGAAETAAANAGYIAVQDH